MLVWLVISATPVAMIGIVLWDVVREERDKNTKVMTIATVVIAVASILSFGAAVSQYVVFGRQLAEMHSSGEQTDKIIETYKSLAAAASKQADASIEGAKVARDNLIAIERAWIGPRNAKSDKAPEASKDLSTTVEYLNTGREPALDVTFDVDSFVASQKEVQDSSADRRIINFVNECKIKWLPLQAVVVFPVSGSSNDLYKLIKNIPGDQIDTDVVDGKKTIYLSGCFVYKTALTIHRSSFCFYYKAPRVNFANWGICQVGNSAD